MSNLALGFAFGVVAALPAGPVNLSLVRTTIKHGVRHGFTLGLGAAIVDAFYMFLALIGISLLQEIPLVTLILTIFGVILLLVLGLKEIFAREEEFRMDTEDAPPRKRGLFLLGALFLLTNPMVIIGFAASVSIGHQYGVIDSSLFDSSLGAVGVFLGTILWFYILAQLIQHYKRKIHPSTLMKINRVFGYVFLVFAASLAYKLVNEFILT